MLIITNLESFRPERECPLVLAVGNFDGLHLGHQALLKYGIDEARKQHGKAGVLTFREHPQRVLHSDGTPYLLTSTEHKLFLLQEVGIDFCFLLPFTKEFSVLEPRRFVEEILVHRLQVREVCLGYNARFGLDRKGDAIFMKKMAEEFGFQFKEMEAVRVRGCVVSSSYLRKLVEAGNFDEVRECLGRPFGIFGKVVKGAGRGRMLGFPTANLEVAVEVLPTHGVYPVILRTVEFQEKVISEGGNREIHKVLVGPWLHGVLNYGFRPTFDQGTAEAIVEVLIMDFQGNLGGKTFEVVFYPRLRHEMRFESSEALKKQIQQDIMEARRVLKPSFSKNGFTKTVD